MSKLIRVAVACYLGSSAALCSAGSWPEFRGANNDGISAEKMLAAWPDGGPKVLWKKPAGLSLGSFAMHDGKAFYLAADGESESCYAVDAKTGNQLWTAPVGNTQERRNGQGGNGPGSTPAIDNGKVYVYGSFLKFMCLNAADGKVVWEHDIQSEFSGQAESSRGIRSWGSAASPIIDGDLVILFGGGDGQTFMAFNKETGAVVWKKHTEKFTHATPVVAEILGKKQIVFIVHSGLVSLDPATGEQLWKAPLDSNNAAAVAASPVVYQDTVYGSVGYGVGGIAYKISKDGDKFAAKQLWYVKGENANQWSTPVIKDGYLYSIQGRRGASLACVELATGKATWTGPAVGQGEVMMIDNKLIVQCADGKLLLVEANPKEYKELASSQPLQGQAWGWPAYSDGVFLYRTASEMAALDLSAK